MGVVRGLAVFRSRRSGGSGAATRGGAGGRTILGATPEQIRDAQRQLLRIGIAQQGFRTLHASEEPSGLEGSGTPSPLAEAISEALGKVTVAVATEAVPTDPATEAVAARAAENAAHDAAAKAGRKVFATAIPAPGAPPPQAPERPPRRNAPPRVGWPAR